MTTGIFPKLWSNGTVVLLPKSGDLSNPGNRRPITQTSVFAILFEKIIHNWLYTHRPEADTVTGLFHSFPTNFPGYHVLHMNPTQNLWYMGHILSIMRSIFTINQFKSCLREARCEAPLTFNGSPLTGLAGNQHVQNGGILIMLYILAEILNNWNL